MINRLVVIHGASGDLFFRKLLIALYKLYCKFGDKVNLKIVGTGSKYKSVEEFIFEIEKSLESQNLELRQAIPSFLKCFHWIEGRCSEKIGAKKISEEICRYREENPTASELHFFSLWPNVYLSALENYLEFGVVTPELVSAWPSNKVQIVLEKPLAETASQAQTLMSKMQEVAGQHKVNDVFVAYDHYLFKSGVWGILVWRFANQTSEPTHNWQKIRSILIRASERVTVGERNGYVGAVMDMIANHLFVIYGLLRIGHPLRKGESFFHQGKWQVSEVDECLDANWLHSRMVSVARELHLPGVIEGLDLARYSSGSMKMLGPDGQIYLKEHPGFIEAGGKSHIETAARLRIRPGVPISTNPSDRWRQETIFSLESGKGTAEKETLYDINYRPVPSQFFENSPFGTNDLYNNTRSIIIERERTSELSQGKFQLEKVWGDSRFTMSPGEYFPSMIAKKVEFLSPLPDVGDGYPQALTELLIPRQLQSGQQLGEGQILRSLCLLPAEVQLGVIEAIDPLLQKARDNPSNWIEYPVGTMPQWQN